MTLYQILGLTGFSSFFVAFVTFIIRGAKKQASEIKALKLGMQALLRDRLLSEYKAFNKQGFVPFAERENFENLYKQYHSLGANGVMDDIREKVLDLPLE